MVFFAGCAGQFFHPSGGYPKADLQKYNVKDVYFRTGDGVLLHGLLVKPATRSRAAILYFHGNAQNLGSQIGNALWLADYGFTVFAIDYRGYGKSGGRADIKGVNADGAAALEKIVALCPGQKDRIIVFGQSLGGGIAIYAVANSRYKQNVKALIVDSAFASYRGIVREKALHSGLLGLLGYPVVYPLTFTISDFYSAVNWVDKIGGVPILLICGTDDTVVPADNSCKLFKKATGPKELWITHTPGHTSFLSRKSNEEALVKYLHECLIQPPASGTFEFR